MQRLTISFRPDLTHPPGVARSLVVGELVIDGHRVVRLDWNADRHWLELDQPTEAMFEQFPWLIRRVLEQDHPADPAAHLAGLFVQSVLSISRVAVA